MMRCASASFMPMLSVSESWRAPLYCLSVVGVMVRLWFEVMAVRMFLECFSVVRDSRMFATSERWTTVVVAFSPCSIRFSMTLAASLISFSCLASFRVGLRIAWMKMLESMNLILGVSLGGGVLV